MNILRTSQRESHQNSETLVVYEYPMNDADINGAVSHLNGRYPVQGFAVNEKCKEMAYVIKGSGKIVVDHVEIPVGPGDLLIISPGEKYYWHGDLDLFLSCTPAWYAGQHKIIR